MLQLRQIFLDRKDAVETDPELFHYAEAFLNLSPGDMSADETDDEDPGPQKAYVRIAPYWRSDYFAGICWRIDDKIDIRKKSAVVSRHRYSRGQPARVRRHRGITVDKKAPSHLPGNWYREIWMDGLSGEDLFELQPGPDLF